MTEALKDGGKFKFIYKELMGLDVNEQKQLVGEFQDTNDMCKKLVAQMSKSYKDGKVFIQKKQEKTYENEIEDFMNFIGE